VKLLSDIFSVLVDHWGLISGILLTMLLSQALIQSVLRRIFRDRITSEEYFSFGVVSWIVPPSLVSLLWLTAGVFRQSAWIGLGLLAALAILSIFLLVQARNESTSGSRPILFVLVALFAAFIFLRLAFLSEVIVPLYFDSAQHFLIIKNLTRNLVSQQNPFFSGHGAAYYHIGFHLLTAFLASSLRADMIQTILVLGQMIVAAIPFSLFSLVKQETQSNRAGIFAVLLAAFGWYMPAYAVNWGKYPALASLPLIPIITCLAYLTLRHKNTMSPGKHLGLNVILLVSVLITGFVHSRSLVVFAIIAVTWIAVAGWQKLSISFRFLAIGVIILGILLEIDVLRTEDVFGLLFDPYWEKGRLITLLVLVLAVFALWVYTRLAFACLLASFLLLGSLLIPVWVPGYGDLTLLDRPFVELILYLPLSLLGGAGLAGLEQALNRLPQAWQANRFWPGRYLGGVLIVLLLMVSLARYNFYQAGCCSIVGRDDLVAIYWMDKNLPPDAIVLIASTELRVIVSDSPQGAAGADAGAWITPLTDRGTRPLPYQSDFGQQSVFDTICRMKAGYLYVGELGATFNDSKITPHPDRYKVLLAMPKAKVYEIVGCPTHSSSNGSALKVMAAHEN
jgi:hypothetical protein